MVTTTLIVDGMIAGTGIRDAVEGGYLEAAKVGISAELAKTLSEWHAEYAAASRESFSDPDAVAELDQKGLAIRSQIADELPDQIVGYYSDAICKRLDDLPHVRSTRSWREDR